MLVPWLGSSHGLPRKGLGKAQNMDVIPPVIVRGRECTVIHFWERLGCGSRSSWSLSAQ